MGKTQPTVKKVAISRAEGQALIFILHLADTLLPDLKGNMVNGQRVDDAFLTALVANVASLQAKVLENEKAHAGK